MHMKILLVEDDDIKANQITEFIDNLHGRSYGITRKSSWQSGIKEIIKNLHYNIIILDMSMPRFDLATGDVYEEFEPFAGLDILREMKRRKINIPTFVVTAFDVFGEEDNKINYDQLNNLLDVEFNNMYLGMTYFNSTSEKWKKDLENIIIEESIKNEDINS